VGQSWRLMLDSNDNWSIDASSMESLHGVDVSWLHHPHKTASRGESGANVARRRRRVPTTGPTLPCMADIY
jgi:hypothetical protein